jgi:hypothetical protein
MVFNFNDRQWRPFSQSKLRELRVLPNELWKNDSTNEGVLVVRRSRNYSEFALGKYGLDYLRKAMEEGRLSAASVVLAERDTDDVFIEKPLAEVVASLAGVEPRHAPPNGPYWWHNEDLTPQYVQGAFPYPRDETPF